AVLGPFATLRPRAHSSTPKFFTASMYRSMSRKNASTLRDAGPLRANAILRRFGPSARASVFKARFGSVAVRNRQGRWQMGTIMIIVLVILLLGGGGGYYGYSRYGGGWALRRSGLGIDHSFRTLVLRRSAYQSLLGRRQGITGDQVLARRVSDRQRVTIALVGEHELVLVVRAPNQWIMASHCTFAYRRHLFDIAINNKKKAV